VSFFGNAQNYDNSIVIDSFKSNPSLENEFINNVFGKNITNGSQHYKNIIDLLQNRVEFLKIKKSSGKDYPSISNISLFNKYNNKLQRDVLFDPLTFNVLKYDLDYFSNLIKIYRVNNTDWVILIKPQTKL
jgi:hypothetical protein